MVPFFVIVIVMGLGIAALAGIVTGAMNESKKTGFLVGLGVFALWFMLFTTIWHWFFENNG